MDKRNFLQTGLLGLAGAWLGAHGQTARAGSVPAASAGLQAAAWSEHTLWTPDGLLSYTRLGQGPVLVVIPGGPGGSGHRLRPFYAPLAREFSVVIVDNIGRGRSDRLADPRRYTLARDAQDIEHLRRHLGTATLALYGHSYGGMVAQHYAIEQRSHVSHLILGNTLHGASSWQAQIDDFKQWLQRHEPQRWSQVLALREQGQLSAAQAVQAVLAPALEPLYWADRTAPHPKASASADPRDAFNPQVYAALLGPDAEWQIGGNLRGVELRPRLAQVAARSLVLTGRYDPVAPPLVAEQLAAALPAARTELQVFERSGHRPHIEEPTLWQARVSQFLKT